MPKEEYVLDFLDKNGKRTVWPRKSFEEHANRREEIRTDSFQARIKKAFTETDIIIESNVDKNCLCYYYYEYTVNSIRRFTKVIAEADGEINIIKSAYRPDRIKELQYGRPLWVREGFRPN